MAILADLQNNGHFWCDVPISAAFLISVTHSIITVKYGGLLCNKIWIEVRFRNMCKSTPDFKKQKNPPPPHKYKPTQACARAHTDGRRTMLIGGPCGQFLMRWLFCEKIMIIIADWGDSLLTRKTLSDYLAQWEGYVVHTPGKNQKFSYLLVLLCKNWSTLIYILLFVKVNNLLFLYIIMKGLVPVCQVCIATIKSFNALF